MGIRYILTRTDEEVDEQLNQAAEGMDQGSKWPGMSYEQGVEAAINWLIGNIDDAPMDE